MLGDGLPGGNFHNDVLNAAPADDAGKQTLVEELKRRAKGSLTSRNYPEAIQLYSKGIEVFPTDAILHANRSMCHLGNKLKPPNLLTLSLSLSFCIGTSYG